MATWGRALEWGKRGSDRPAARAAAPVRDWMLEGAIAREQIALRFQPQIEPSTGRIVGVEALARWDGAKSAEALFERAKAAGLAERLSRLIQRKALTAAAAWEGPLRKLGLSINLLPEDVSRAGFDQWLLDEIDCAGIDPERVTVEITESALLVDRKAVSERLSRLRDAGVTVALDDFGTGYASLAYLTSLPLDMIKIDRSLVAGIVGGKRDRILIKAMIRLARDLDLKLLVEGVEDVAQLALLADWGCELYQGFVGASALDEAELARFVAASALEAA